MGPRPYLALHFSNTSSRAPRSRACSMNEERTMRSSEPISLRCRSINVRSIAMPSAEMSGRHSITYRSNEASCLCQMVIISLTPVSLYDYIVRFIIQHFIKSINQSINQSILFLIKRYIINALSAVQWNTHISLNTYIYIYTVKYSTHTSIHTRQPLRPRYNVFISFTHTLTLVDVASGPCLPYSW